MADCNRISAEHREQRRKLSPHIASEKREVTGRGKHRDWERQREDEGRDQRQEDAYSRHSSDQRRRSRSPRSRFHHRRDRSTELHARRHRSRDNNHESSRRRRSTSSSASTDRRKERIPSLTKESKRSKVPLPSQQEAYTGERSTVVSKPPLPTEKQKPNFAPSGKLAAETNTAAGTSIILKYNEPPESRKPPSSQPWRLYVFKGSETLGTIELGTRSCWLFGRERSVVDFPIEHPSCSKQHAVLQFRFVEKKNEYGDKEGKVRPYVIDLESANGTKVNGEPLPERRFIEVRSKDVIAFGESTREYVLMLPPAG